MNRKYITLHALHSIESIQLALIGNSRLIKPIKKMESNIMICETQDSYVMIWSLWIPISSLCTSGLHCVCIITTSTVVGSQTCRYGKYSPLIQVTHTTVDDWIIDTRGSVSTKYVTYNMQVPHTIEIYNMPQILVNGTLDLTSQLNKIQQKYSCSQ